MSDHTTIAAVIGSLRTNSFNRAVFEAARGALPEGIELIEASIADVPLFSQEIEETGDPEAVTAFKEAVAAADALIIFTPEYNRSVPGVTKNAVDWLSRPFLAGPIAQRRVGIVAASPGGGDAAGSRAHLAQGVAGAGGDVYEPTLGLPSIAGALTDGTVTDEATLGAIGDWVSGFLASLQEEQQ